MAGTFFSKARGLFRTAVQEPPAAPASGDKKPGNTYHAVSILTGPDCCYEARALRGLRFLSREAPQLPLKACGRKDCTCRYEHHQDRRGAFRRVRDMGVAVDGWQEVEKRNTRKRGRRETDQK